MFLAPRAQIVDAERRVAEMVGKCHILLRVGGESNRENQDDRENFFMHGDVLVVGACLG